MSGSTNPRCAALTPIILYGSPMSLYTGRARSYLIKARLTYREVPTTSAHFRQTVLPKAGGRRSLPTVELPDGTVIRDGVAIVDHFEAESGHGFSPASPKQRVISRLFDAIGAEGLLRPAMHYRWDFLEQRDFLHFHFETIFPPGGTPSAEKRMRMIREIVNPSWGVVPEVIGTIEELYEGLLDRLHVHFGQFPYLLGGRPCIGDFGMMAPLYGHLGRDPHPRTLMQTRAWHTFRWVERMNRPEPDIGEFEDQSTDYLPDDRIPDTLIEVLRHLAIDYVPETRGACEFINEWLEENRDMPPGTTAERGVGTASFDLVGTRIDVLAQPFRFHVLSRVQEEFEALAEPDRSEVHALLTACNMAEVLELKLTRAIGRKNNLEVWL